MFSFGSKSNSNSKSVTIPYNIIVDKKSILVDSTTHNTNLRKLLIQNKVDVYPLKAKLTGNCGGAGICGTCAVKVLNGKDFLNPPSKNELNTLKGKPEDWRLSCCSKVGGPIEIKTKP
ncbi:MAG: (2Fe-2S)-binding protein [Cyanobacteria bacterium]|nr:(2Fe-2S)-binding protein [Cyanobacteriota bacterium]